MMNSNFDKLVDPSELATDLLNKIPKDSKHANYFFFSPHI